MRVTLRVPLRRHTNYVTNGAYYNGVIMRGVSENMVRLGSNWHLVEANTVFTGPYTAYYEAFLESDIFQESIMVDFPNALAVDANGGVDTHSTPRFRSGVPLNWANDLNTLTSTVYSPTVPVELKLNQPIAVTLTCKAVAGKGGETVVKQEISGYDSSSGALTQSLSAPAEAVVTEDLNELGPLFVDLVLVDMDESL